MKSSNMLGNLLALVIAGVASVSIFVICMGFIKGGGQLKNAANTEAEIVAVEQVETPAEPEKVEVAAPVPSQPVVNTGGNNAAIRGVVKYDGEVPKFKELKMDADPICLTKHTEPVFPQTLLLGEDKTMANVFVHIISGLPNKKYPVPTEEVVLDQKGCMYDPHVLGLMVGQTVNILNPDGTLHNIHTLSKANPEFNKAMPKFRTEMKHKFNKPEFMFPMKCDVHPWMGAWIAVMDHPFFNVTKTDGQFAINDIPPGEYEIEVWHEKLGTQTQTIQLVAGQVAELNFTYAR